MADGTITIGIITEDGSVRKAVANLGGLENGSKKASVGIMSMVTAMGLVKVASAAFGVLKNSVGDAVSRFDTMQKFPKVMKSLGYSTKDSTTSINQLADGIEGLPTKLDDIVSVTQQLTSTTGDLETSTQAALGLNNAFLASGASVEDTSRGMIQYSQMLAKGKVDMQSWRTIQETMPIGLKKTAEAMGFVGESATTDLYEALRDGEVTFNDFQNAIIELGTGTGELAQLAKVNSAGIGTSFSNLRNSISKNVANIITKFDEIVQQLTNKSIAQHIDNLKVLFNAMGKSIIQSMDGIVPVVKRATRFIQENAGAFQILGKIIPVIVAGFLAFNTTVSVLRSVSAAIGLVKSALLLIPANPFAALIGALAIAYASSETFRKAVNSLVSGLKDHPEVVAGVATAIIGMSIAMNTSAIASKATAAAETIYIKALYTKEAALKLVKGAQLALTAAMTIGKFIYASMAATVALLTGALTAEAAAAWVANAAMTMLNAVMAANPFVLAAMAVAGLAVAVGGLVKWLNKGTEEGKKNKEESENIKKTTDELTKSIQEITSAYEEKSKAIDRQSGALKGSISEIDKLMQKEKLSAADKVLLQKEIEGVNKLAEGLNLTYDEQSGKLTTGNGLVVENIELLKEQALQLGGVSNAKQTEAAADERLNQLKKEEVEIYSQLDEINKKQKQWQEDREAGKVKEREYQEVIQDTSAQYDILQEKLIGNGAAQTAAAEEIVGAQAKIKESNEVVRESYVQLNENQMDVINKMTDKVQEYRDKITALNGEIDLSNQTSAAEWLKSMSNNNQVVADMATNITSLMGRMSDDSIATLQNMGPDAALMISQMAQMSDPELQKFEEQIGNSSKNGMNLMKAGLKDEELPGAIEGLVSTTRSTLKNSIQSAGFAQIGKDISSGVTTGIKDDQGIVLEAVEGMAKGAQQAYKKADDSHSPSKVYKGFGKDAIDGLTLGFKNNSSSAENAGKSVAENVQRQFDSLKNAMESIGNNAMYGLNNGLLAIAPTVYDTARKIAESTAKVMKSALDIHSPSRLFRDEIGAMMTKGLALGLLDEFPEGQKAMDKLNGLAFPSVQSPEFAIAGYGTSGVSQQVIHNATNSQTHKTEINITIEKAELANDADIEATGEKLAKNIERRSKRRLGG